jgi:hypothetical protein
MNQRFELQGPTLILVAVLVGTLLLTSVFDSIVRLSESLRRARLRYRELVALETLHALACRATTLTREPEESTGEPRGGPTPPPVAPGK